LISLARDWKAGESELKLRTLLLSEAGRSGEAWAMLTSEMARRVRVGRSMLEELVTDWRSVQC